MGLPANHSTTFIGRERELGELRAAFDDAVNGNGRLVMVVGEPGIGKTTLCEELARHVEAQGGTTLIGHCYEEGSLSLPYLAFVEAMRDYVLAQDSDGLTDELGTAAADVARIVPEIQDRLGIEPSAPTSPEEDRYRLLRSVATFFRAASQASPLLVILEDLHDADRATLDMLTYLSRNLGGSRLLIAGTYRDIEVDRAHPLSSALAELRRSSSFSRIPLRGLNADEVRRMMSSVAGRDLSWGLAESVHRQTEGNPLFVQEVVRYLAEQGLLDESADGTAAVTMSIPEGLRDVIGKRLSSLSTKCNDVLRIAAVIGRDFRLDILEHVSTSTEDDLFEALEEARTAGVIEERSSVGSGAEFRFTHAFFRQTLYEETIAPRRIRLHQQVGRAIEAVHARRLYEHAAELAEHFGNSSNDEDLEKAVAYGEMAAKRAASVYAYGDVVVHLERCLEVHEVVDPADKTRRCDLLLALAEAVIPAGAPLQAYDRLAPEALRLAESIEDDHRASRACQAAITGLRSHRGLESFGSPEMRWWNEQADIHAQPGTRDRALADADLSTILLSEGRYDESWEVAIAVVDLAREIGEPELLAQAAGRILGRPCSPRLQSERSRLAREFMTVPLDGVPPINKAELLYRCAFVHLELGERGRAEELWRQVEELADRTRLPILDDVFRAHQVYVATLDGRLEEAVSMSDEALTELVAMTPTMQAWLGWTKLRAQYLKGQFDEMLSDILALTDSANDTARDRGLSRVLIWLHQAHVLANLGREAEALELLNRCLAVEPLNDATSASVLIPLLDAALSLRRVELVEQLASMLGPVDFLASSFYHIQCVARLLGGSAALLNKADEARAHYRKALDVASSIRNRPEVALTHLQLGELLLDHYPSETTEAREHLEFALAESRDMKMRPSVEKAEALLIRLDGRSKKTAQKYPDGLSAREVDVLRLIAAGNSNQQIADALYISPSTVAHHVTSILTKTDSSNRAEAATYASRNGLT